MLLDLLAERHPDFAARLRAIAAEPDAGWRELWPTLPKIALDHAVAEPAAAAGRVAVVPGVVRLGRHRRLRLARDALLGADEAASTVLGDAALVQRDRRAAAWWCPAGGRLVAVVGLDDVVVVDTPDALLVTTRAHAQEVKEVGGRPRASPAAPT